jgi:hypothetical protein
MLEDSFQKLHPLRRNILLHDGAFYTIEVFKFMILLIAISYSRIELHIKPKLKEYT